MNRCFQTCLRAKRAALRRLEPSEISCSRGEPGIVVVESFDSRTLHLRKDWTMSREGRTPMWSSSLSPVASRAGIVAVACLLLCAAGVAAQNGGTLTGYARSSDGEVVPGVLVSATSESLLGERNAVTNAEGYFRLPNLPPGSYTVTAELAGFSTLNRTVQMRAGATFQVTLEMKLGAVEEIVNVSAESPMININSPGQVLTIDGDFQRTVPVQSRHNWSDVMEMTPGVHARPFDDGSGRMVYFGHATEHFAHVIQLEGIPAAAYDDAQATYIQMSTDIIADMEVKTSGTEASSPLGTGLVMNMVTKSGGNSFSGSAAYNYQPLAWVEDNTDVEGETPANQTTEQLDASLGGPFKRDRAWFFAAIRDAQNESGISRVASRVDLLRDYYQGIGGTFDPFNNVYEGTFPYAKVTAQFGSRHNVNAYWQEDEVLVSSVDEGHFDRNELRQTGGSVYGARLASVLSDNLTMDISLSYNDKASSDHPSTLDLFEGPQLFIYERVRPRTTTVSSLGLLLEGGNVFDVDFNPSSQQLLRADFTFFKNGWKGNHEFKAGLFYAPKNRRKDFSVYPNGGFFREYRVAIDEFGQPRTSTGTTFDLSNGTIPYRQRIRVPDSVVGIDNEDQDIGIYLQDSWSATDRLTINLGLRVDWIERFDRIFGIKRMDDTAVGPRLGFSYQLTKDARNILRGYAGRVHEQVNGRDYATGISAGITVTEINRYDTDFDGIYDSERITPGQTPELAALAFDDLTQPYTDELVLGYRRQFGRNIGLDAALIHREVKNRYGEIDINGFYPDGPRQPFGGFGRVDPERGRFLQITNNDWSKLVYDAIEITVAKRMANNWQAFAGMNYQVHELDGDWNPTDPARFIQPDAHENTKCMWMPRGRRDDNSYQGGSNSTYCPTWRPYTFRIGGVYNAPKDIVLSGSFFIQAGPWSGPIFEELDEYTPELEAIYGPEEVTSSTGRVEDNPLAELTRFRFATRDEGQVRLDDVMTMNLRVAKTFKLGGDFELETAVQIFNPFNWGDHHQYTYDGANNVNDANYLEPRNRQAPRSYQAFLAVRF